MLSTPQKSTPLNQIKIKDILFLLIGLFIFYALWLGSYPLFTPDEARYSEIAREMLTSHNFITPNLNGVAFLDKPILYYWLQASMIHLFGLKEWALRFWPMCLGIICCLISYSAGCLLLNRRIGLLAALILATSPLYYGGSHYANLDLEVASFISNALLCFIIAIETNKPSQRQIFLILAYIMTSLAFLTKGLIGIVFPILIIGLWIFLLKRWQIFLRLHLITGLIIFLLIAAPWYILVQKANPQFFHYFFLTQQFSRFLTKGDFNNQTSVWFYLPVVFAGFAPWSLFLIQAMFYHLKIILKNCQLHRIELFLILWSVSIFLFFSIPKSKTLGYILPIFPALALIIANYLDIFWNKLYATGIHIGIISFTLLCMISSCICILIPEIAYFAVSKSMTLYLNITAGILIIAVLFTLYFLYQKQFKFIIYILFVTSVLFLLTFISSAATINHKSIKSVALILKPLLQPQDEVVTYQKYFQDLPIYLQHRIIIAADWHANYILHHDNWQRELWFGMPYQDTSSWLIEEPTFWQHWHSKKRVFVFMYNEYYADFVKLAHDPVYKIAQSSEFTLVSNTHFTLQNPT